MAHAFNGHGFGQFLGDVERLLNAAREHERQLTAFATLLEGEGAVAQVSAVGLEVSTTPCATTNQLRLTAAGQRQLVEMIATRLVGPLAAIAGSGSPRVRVLVVDDSDSGRDTTAAILEGAGFDAITASNGLEGVIVAHYARPSVILMDVTMPVLDGLEAARLIHASTVTRDLPVVAYTANPEVVEGPVRRWFVERSSQARRCRGHRCVGATAGGVRT